MTTERKGPLWALVERWEIRRDVARAEAKVASRRSAAGKADRKQVAAQAIDACAAELADVLTTIERGDA